MIKGFKKAWDQVTGSSKLPPDQALIAAERKLTRLGSIVDVMRSNFTRYTELAIQLGDAGIIISNDVSVFYGNAKQKSRQASVEMFSKTQKSVAVSAAEEFRSQLRAGTNGIVDEFTAWTNDISNAKALVAECQRFRQTAFNARLKLESTKEQLAKKRQNVGGVFGTSAGEIFDMEQRLAPLEAQAKEFEMKYNRLLQQVETTSTEIVTKRFTTFDRIYVLLMEAQLAFFDKGSSAVNVFKRPVSNYRAKFPKGKARSNPTAPAPAKPAPVGRKEDVTSKRRGTTPEPVVAKPQKAAPRPPPQAAKPASAEPLLDLDFGTMPQQSSPNPAPTVVPQQPTAAAPAKPRDDRSNSMDQLLSFLGGDDGESAQPKPQPIPENKVVPDPNDLSQLFGTFGGVSPNVAQSSNQPQPDLLGFDVQPQQPASIYDPMSFGMAQPSKPELSNATNHGMNINAGWGTNTRAKGLSAKEIRAIDAKVEQKLQEHQDRVQAEEDLIEAKIDTRDKTENMIKAWSHQNNVRRDLRTLLSTMQNVLWADSGWKPVGLTDLLTPKQIKRQYRKAIMVIHPDRQSAKSIEIQVVAAQVFEVINEAWGEFQKKPKQR